MGDRTQVNVRLSEEQKERWREYIKESPEYDGFSDMIRHAVEREIAADDAPVTPHHESQAQTADTGDVLTEIQGLEGQLEQLQDAVEGVQQDVKAGGGVPESVRTDVYAALPSDAADGMTVQQLSDAADVSPWVVAMAVERLRYETGVVETTERDGETAYYKE